MLSRTYAISPRSRLEMRQGTAFLVCDHPLQAVSLNDTARRLVEALRPGVPLHEIARGITPEVVRYLDDLVALGLLTAEYRVRMESPNGLFEGEAAGSQGVPPMVEVVIPVFGNPTGLARCLEALAGQAYPPARMRITVVDDGSPVPLDGVLIGGGAMRGMEARLLRLEENQGPASARNHGAGTPWPIGVRNAAAAEPEATQVAEPESHPDTGPEVTQAKESEEIPARDPLTHPAPVLAFIDSDCVPEPDWVAGLVAALESPEVSAVGGPVRPLDSGTLLGRYEGACSSLVLGERPGAVGGMRDALPYLPSCNLAVRREAFESVGGFRAGWRFGEDVDLSWRLAEAGRVLFYLGGGQGGGVRHDFRTRPDAFMERRRLYARSEGPLRRAHPGRFKAVAPWWVWVGCAPLVMASVVEPWGTWVLQGSGPSSGMGALAGTLTLTLILALGIWLLGSISTSLAQAWGFRRTHGPGSQRGIALDLLPRLVASAPRNVLGALLQAGRRWVRTGAILWPVALVAWPGLLPLLAGVLVLGIVGERLALAGKQARDPEFPGVRRGKVAPGWGTFLAGYALEAPAYSLGWLEGWWGFLGRGRGRAAPHGNSMKKVPSPSKDRRF